jgi:hypothetical protein
VKRSIDGDLLVVSSETVALGIRVGEEPCLEDGICGGFDAGDEVGGGECGLFYFCEIIRWLFDVFCQLRSFCLRFLGVGKGKGRTFRFKVIFPTGRSGTSPWGQTFVRSKIFQRKFSACSGDNT